jgi:hypothetical protein
LGATPPATVGFPIFANISTTTIALKVPAESTAAYSTWLTDHSSKFGNVTLVIEELPL